MERFIEQEMKHSIGPLGKLDCLPSKKLCLQLKSNRVLTCFRGGLILVFHLLLDKALHGCTHFTTPVTGHPPCSAHLVNCQ